MIPVINLRPQPIAPPSLASRVPWGTLLAILLCLGLAGGVWHHFIWQRRMPQEYTLTSAQGQATPARLEAHNDEVVKYTLLADNSTRYAAISALSGQDQEFIKQLNSPALEFQYPFECFMREMDAKPAAIRVEGRSTDWVRYTLLSDRSTHYVPLGSFSSGDQTILTQLPSKLTLDTPVELALTDRAGHVLAERIEARSSELVKLSSRDGTILYYPIHELSDVDQKLVQLLPNYASLIFPFECTLTDNNNKRLNVRLEGRSANTIKYILLSDGLTYYRPVDDFSIIDRQVFRSFPSSLQFTLPFDYDLSDAQGRSLRVRLKARSSNIVKFTLLETGREYYWPMTEFSLDSQKFLALLPAGLRLDYPIDDTLTSASGQSLEAHILGRDADSVKFQLADKKTYTYDLNKLSAESQAFLRLLPANLVDASIPQSDQAYQIEALRGQLAAALELDRTTQQAIGQGTSQQPSLDQNRDQIEAFCKQIDPLLNPTPKQAKAKMAQNVWSNLMKIIRRDDLIRKDMANAGPGEREALRVDLRHGQADLVSALNEIYVEVGTYAP